MLTLTLKHTRALPQISQTHLLHTPEQAANTCRLSNSGLTRMCAPASFNAVTRCDILSPLRCHRAPTCF